MKTILRVLACIGLCCAIQAQDYEYKYLDSIVTASNWRPEEATTTQTEMTLEGHPVICFHIDVDFHAGEEKYPIGWPRMYMAIPGADRDWSDYDSFEFKILTKSSRTALPKNPLSSRLFAENGKVFNFELSGKLTLNEWSTITVKTDKLIDSHCVTRIGFNIAEANYQDKDMVEFYIGGYRLVRSKDCKVVDMGIGDAVLMEDVQVLPVSLDVQGPVSSLSRGVPFELKKGDMILRRETLPVCKGGQILRMDVSELRLTPGTYTLTAFPEDAAKRISAEVRIVESPWKEVAR